MTSNQPKLHPMKKKSASKSAFFKLRGLIGVLLCFGAITLLLFALGKASAQPRTVSSTPQVQRQNPYSDAWLAANHGKYDNIWTAEYETRLQPATPGAPLGGLLGGLLNPLYGPDVRMSNGNVLGSGQNEFQIDVNPLDNLNAIGTSNDGQTAGVGIFRTTDGGATWTSRDASFYGAQAACCDPGVAYGPDGHVYAIILDTSPTATYILRRSRSTTASFARPRTTASCAPPTAVQLGRVPARSLPLIAPTSPPTPATRTSSTSPIPTSISRRGASRATSPLTAA